MPIGIIIASIGAVSAIGGGAFASRSKKLEAKGRIAAEREELKQELEKRKIEIQKAIRNKKTGNALLIAGVSVFILAATTTAIIIKKKKG